MEITFNAIGLAFEATVHYSVGRPAKTNAPAEYCYPAEYPEIEFETLAVDGKDALFLMDSIHSEYIEEAAMEAAEEKIKDMILDAQI